MSTDGPVDPDCRTGSHKACPAWTWDDTEDREVPCACPCHATPAHLPGGTP